MNRQRVFLILILRVLLVAIRWGAWKIDRHIDVLHDGVFFHHEYLRAFFVAVAMLMKRMVNGQGGRGKARKQTASSRCTHG